MSTLQTIVELPEFLRRAKAIMVDEERTELVNFIAANPEAGGSLGGGLRKVRIPRLGGGKCWGLQDHLCRGRRSHAGLPRHMFARNEKDNLTRVEQAAAVELAKMLVVSYGDHR